MKPSHLLLSFGVRETTHSVGPRIGTLRVPLLIAALVATVPMAGAQQARDPRVADLVRAGKVRIALFPPQYTKDRTTGELRGVWADIARAFAARVGVELVFVEHSTPPKMVECLESGACDVGFLGFDTARAADVEGFSPAFIEFDYTYLVPAASAIRHATDVDQPAVRIAVVQAHASTLTLSRIRKHATLVSVGTPDSAFDLLRAGRVDAWASARQALVEYSAQVPGLRVLEDRYGVNRAAVVVAKGHAARLAYISEFIEEIKASGFVEKAIKRSGWRGVRVAPLANPMQSPRINPW